MHSALKVPISRKHSSSNDICDNITKKFNIRHNIYNVLYSSREKDKNCDKSSNESKGKI